jgi:GT2 family glycosyltransferase
MAANMGDLYENPDAAASVGIVILNYNNYKDTSECLDSLKSVSYPNFQVFVVDNVSTDRSAECISSEFPECEFIFNDRNLGFAAGNKIAVIELLDQRVDYLLLLNNDTIVEDGFISPLVETAEENEHVGLVGGLIDYFDEDTEDYWYAGGSISPYVVELDTETQPKSQYPYETGYCSGALMLINAEFARTSDILREEYFFRRDQLDISWRARKDGWKLMVDPRSEIKDKVSATVGDQSPFKMYYDMRGRLFFVSQNLPPHHSMIFYIFFVFTRPVVFAKWISQRKPTRVRAHLLAIFDFVRGEYPIRDLPLKN